MRLNADIIYQNLDTQLTGLEFSGELDAEMTLMRPEFYLDKNANFLKDHVYVCSADHLPGDPVINGHMLLICLGRSDTVDAFTAKCSVIFVPESENIFRVFNLAQEVFNRYEEWEGKMNEVLRTSASLQTLIDLSRDIFENPLLLIGSDFRYLAYTDKEYLENDLEIRLEGPTFDQERLAQFLTMHEMATDIREPLLLNLLDRTTLSVNIFDGSQFLGCITVFGEFRGIKSSDMRLCMHLSDIIRQAFAQTPNLAGDNSLIRQALQKMVKGRTANNDEIRAISRINTRQDYVCIYLQISEQQGMIPAGYVSSLIEQNYAGSQVFENEGHVVAVIFAEKGTSARFLAGVITEFFEKMQMRCGMSHVFSDLYDVQFSFRQAQAALEMGMKHGGNGSVYYFEDHILQKLLTGAVGDIPIRYLYTEGLMRLWKHDQKSSVSYIDTLRTYMECNQSVAQTARSLNLHRSSLIDRLDRIFRLLDCDLNDLDNRLLLQMILRAER